MLLLIIVLLWSAKAAASVKEPCAFLSLIAAILMSFGLSLNSEVAPLNQLLNLLPIAFLEFQNKKWPTTASPFIVFLVVS